MIDSIDGAVTTALALQNWTTAQESQNLLLRKVLDGQSNTILNLVNSVPNPTKLATVGAVGTRLHAIA